MHSRESGADKPKIGETRSIPKLENQPFESASPNSSIERLIKRARQRPTLLTHNEVLRLQQTIGNRAVGKLINAQKSSTGPAASKAELNQPEKSEPVLNQSVAQRFYVETDEDPGYRWVENDQWDADKYEVSEKETGWLFYNLYRLKQVEPPQKPKPGKVPSVPPPKEVRAVDEFSQLKTLVSQMNKMREGKTDLWDDQGKLNALNAYLKQMSENKQKDKSYKPKAETLTKQLSDARELMEALKVYKPAPKSEKSGEKDLLPSYITVDDGSGDWEINTSAPREAKPRNTAVNWLTGFGGWTIRSHMAYYEKTYSYKGEDYKVHISLPLEAVDRVAQITENSASGIWVGRKIHITMRKPEAEVLKTDPRIWLNDSNEWQGSVGEMVPAGGAAWLLDQKKTLLTASGLTGTLN